MVMKLILTDEMKTWIEETLFEGPMHSQDFVRRFGLERFSFDEVKETLDNNHRERPVLTIEEAVAKKAAYFAAKKVKP